MIYIEDAFNGTSEAIKVLFKNIHFHFFIDSYQIHIFSDA